MRVTLDQSTFLPELALVATAAEVGSTIPGLARVRLEARETGTLRLTANRFEYGLASELPAEVAEPGVICLPAKPLASLVSALEGRIVIRTSANDYATITAGKSRSRMPGEADAVQLLPRKDGAPSPKQIHKHGKPSTVWHEIVVEQVIERRSWGRWWAATRWSEEMPPSFRATFRQ